MIAGLIARIRSLFRGMHHDVDADMQAEFAHHMESRTRDLVKSGRSHEEAQRQAKVEFGGTYNYKEAGRDARGLRWFDAFRVSWLDLKLGARMARRYPGLTLVGGLAMGVAIALGGGVLGTFALLKDPDLPLDEGDQIVGIQMWNTKDNSPERQILHDFAEWRQELRSVRDLSAFRTTVGNMATADGGLEPTRAAAMTASGFRVARVQPLLGRYLVDADEQRDATSVVVLGHDLWQSRFTADSGVVGRTLRLGTASYTIVGVMPRGFAFPVNHSLWVPLRADPLQHKRGEGPFMYVIGRLAPDASVDEARAELSTIGARAAQQFPETHAMLRARVLPFAQSWFDFDSPEMMLAYGSMQLFVTLLLIVICAHVAILVYARTATRQREIVVRTALGASRARIVAQLFGEALALSAVGSIIGLAIIWVMTSQLEGLLAQFGVDFLPFWVRPEVSTATIVYVVALAILGAFIVGVIPALQATGRRVGEGLQRLSGHATVRVGRTWSALIIAEVALTVAALPLAVRLSWDAIEEVKAGPGFAAERYLSASVTLDRDASTVAPANDPHVASRFARARDELLRRLAAEHDVASVAYALTPPGSERKSWVQVDTSDASAATADAASRRYRWRYVRHGRVDVGYFAAFDVPIVSGRAFGPADTDSAARTVIVNRSFVDSVLHGRNAIGSRVRPVTVRGEAEIPGSWYEIVGVADDFPRRTGFDAPAPAVYVAAAARAQVVSLAIRVRGADAAAFAGRLRAVAAEVQPAVQIREIKRLDDVLEATHLPLYLFAVGLATITLSVLVLSSAGVYALMSVLVTQRRREIGIRMALGASHAQVLSSVFLRSGAKLAAGVVLGLGANALLNGADDDLLGPRAPVILTSVSFFIAAVGVLAAMGPARRTLGIQPTVALKEEP